MWILVSQVGYFDPLKIMETHVKTVRNGAYLVIAAALLLSIPKLPSDLVFEEYRCDFNLNTDMKIRAECRSNITF